MGIFQTLPKHILAKYGYLEGSKSDATHYSTFDDSRGYQLVKFVDGRLYVWKEFDQVWQTTAGLNTQTCTALTEPEPNFRCGPPKLKHTRIESADMTQRETFYPKIGVSHKVGD